MVFTKRRDQAPSSVTSCHQAVARTLAQSPKAQWMLPAKLRDQSHEDIVIVREFGISLEELRDDRLIELEPRADFDTRILAAKVLETGPQDSVDTIVQQRNSDHSNSPGTCPPHVLVLCLASGHLLFVTVQMSSSRALEFVYSRSPLPNHKSERQRFGKHLAVNSESRLLACSAAYGNFGLIALKDVVTEYEACVSEPRRLSRLVREERFFKVDGNILKMDFMCSAESLHEEAKLLLLVSKGQETYVLIYTWNSRESLLHVSLDERYPAPLPVEDRKPLHLIPLRRPMSFTLVFNAWIALYSIRPDGEWHRDWHSLQDKRSESPWVQWARPVRNKDRQNVNDDFYICRQDGLIWYIELQVKPDLGIDVRFEVGYLKDCRIGTGFVVMSGTDYAKSNEIRDPAGSDVLLVAGDVTQGGVYVIEARKQPKCVQVLPNWAPVNDVLKVDKKIVDPSSDCATAFFDNRLFVCGGKGFAFINKEPVECGTISELRHGYEAQIRYRKLQYGSSAVTGLWALNDKQHQRVIFLLSVPERTLAAMVQFPVRDDTSGKHRDPIVFYNADEGTAYGMRADAETLVAGCTSTGLAVQVTPIGICILNFCVQSDVLFHPLGSGSSIVAASLHIHRDMDLIVTCIKSGNDFALLLSQVKSDGTVKHADQPTALEGQPNVLDARTVRERCFVVTGNSDCRIAVFEVDVEKGVTPLAKYNMATILSGPSFTAINSLVILGSSGRNELTVLCGLRSGWILYVALSLSENTVQIGQTPAFRLKAQHSIGRTSVKITLDSTDSSACFVMCDSKTFLFRQLSTGVDDSSYRLSYLLLSDHLAERAGMPFQCQQDQLSVHAVARVPVLPDSLYLRDLEGSVGCVLDNELVFCQLSSGPKVVPRTMSLEGNPKHLAFSKRLRKIIAAVEMSSFQNEAARDKTIFKAVHPNDSTRIHTIAGISLIRESVSQLMIWRPVVDGKEYEMMVVVANNDERGRLIFCKIVAGAEPELKVNYSRSFPKQRLYRVAPYGNSAIILCVENVLVLQVLELPARKWRSVCEHKLPSPAVAITVSANGVFIYVTTSRHSLHILTVQDEKFRLLESSIGSLDALNQTLISSGVMISGTLRQGTGFLIGYAQPAAEAFEQGKGPSTEKRSICKQFETKVNIPIHHFESSGNFSGGYDDLGETIRGLSADGTMHEISILEDDLNDPCSIIKHVP